MNIETPVSDVEALSAERQRLEKEQDELFAQLKSDPNNIDAQEELKITLKQIEAIDGPGNKNINQILQELGADEKLAMPANGKRDDQIDDMMDNLNAKAAEKLTTPKPAVQETPNTVDIAAEEDLIEIRQMRNQINELLEKMPAELLTNFPTRKNEIDTATDDLTRPGSLDAKEISSLFGRYKALLDDIKIASKKS